MSSVNYVLCNAVCKATVIPSAAFVKKWAACLQCLECFDFQELNFKNQRSVGERGEQGKDLLKSKNHDRHQAAVRIVHTCRSACNKTPLKSYFLGYQAIVCFRLQGGRNSPLKEFKAYACGCDERSNNNSAGGLLKQDRGVAGVTVLSPSLGVTRVAGRRFTSQNKRTLAELGRLW